MEEYREEVRKNLEETAQELQGKVEIVKVDVDQDASLAANFRHRDKEPMLVTISPKDGKPELVAHGGQEFNYVISGKIAVVIGAKTIVLNEGDSIYFDPRIRHGQYAVDGEARFLTVIDKE